MNKQELRRLADAAFEKSFDDDGRTVEVRVSGADLDRLIGVFETDYHCDYDFRDDDVAEVYDVRDNPPLWRVRVVRG